MAFEKKIYDCKILFLVLIGIPLIASTNIDCGGKSFHCVNSTHFMICVDFGGGVSTTVDDLVISCPPSTLCQRTNHFECEFPVKTTPMPQTQVTEVTNEISTTPQWEEIIVTTMFRKNASTEQLDLKYIDGTNLTTVADVTTDVPLQNTSSLLSEIPFPFASANETGTQNSVATTESTYKSTVYTETNNANVTIANANETINNLENTQTDTYIIGTDVLSGLNIIDTETTLASEITDNLISASNFTDADNNINSTESLVTLNTIIETTTMANKPSLQNNNSSDNVKTTNLIEDIYFTTSIPDLVTATTIEERLTQVEMLTPLIFDGVQNTTDTITTVSEYSIGLFNISERVDNKTGPMKESEMENIVTTTTATPIFKTSSHSTSSNLINETAINTGSEANETYNTSIASANTPGTNVTDPPTTEVIMTNTEKYVNSNTNIQEIRTDTTATNIDNTSGGIVTTTDISYTEGEMAAVENKLLNGTTIAAGDSSLTTKKTNKEIVTANPVTDGFISNTDEMLTSSGLPRSEIVTFVSTTIPSNIEINESSINSKPQNINLNDTTVTTENVITQTGKTTIQQPVTNKGNDSTIEKNLTYSKNISEEQSTSQVTLLNSTDVINSTDKETAITLSNNQSVTEAPAIIITDFQVTASTNIKQNQPINHDLYNTQNENQKTENVQKTLTNGETLKSSWSASTIVESSTTATTMTNDIYLHEPVDKQIEKITTTITSNVNILEFLSTTNPTDVVSRTTATAKEIEYTQDRIVGIPHLVVNNASNTSPKLEGSVNEPTEVNMESILQPEDNNEANNLIQTISTKMVIEENPATTSRSFVTMTELNQGNTSTIASSASPQNSLETVSTTLPSPTSVLSISSNFTNGTGIEITSTITPLNTISTEIDKIGTVTNVKSEPKVDNPLQNVLINIDFSTEMPPARDVLFQTQNIFTATNNAFGKTTESYVGDNQNVTTQDTMIILTITSDGLASYSSTTNALDVPKQIVQGVTTKKIDEIRNPAIKEDGIVTPVTQTESSSTIDQQNTFLNTQAQIGSATANGPQGGLVNSQAQTGSSPTDGPQGGLGNSQAQTVSSPTDGPQGGLGNSQAQTESSSTNDPQGGLENSQAQTESSSTNDPQGGLENSQAQTGSSPTDGPQGGLGNSQAQTESSSTNDPQGVLENSQTQTGSSPTDGPQGGLVNSPGSSPTDVQQDGLANSQAQTGSSPADGLQGGLGNSQAATGSYLANSPPNGFLNGQVQTGSPLSNGPQDGLVNSQATTESSLANGPQGGFVNGQVQTGSSLMNGPQGGLGYSQAQTESSSAIGPQSGPVYSQAMTGSSPTDGPQGGLANSQAQTGSSPTDGPEDSLVKSQAQIESSPSDNPQGGLGNSQAQTVSSSTDVPQGGLGIGQALTGSSPTDGPQGVLGNIQAQTESSSTNDPQGGLENSQAQTGSSPTDGPQGGLVNFQAQTGSSPTDGPQGSLVNNQAQIERSSTIGPQGSLVNSQAQTGSSPTDGSQGGLINSQVQTRSSPTDGPQGSLVNSQAQTGSSSTNDPQGGLVNSQAQTGSSPSDRPQGGLVNSQAQTESSSTNDPQGGLVNSQAQTGSSPSDRPQGGLVNSQAQTESSSTNDPQGGLEQSQAQTGSSPTDGPQGGLVNSQAQTRSSPTDGPQGSLVNNQAQIESSSTIGPQGGLVNSQAQTGSSPTDGPQGGIVNSQVQTGSSPTDGPQGGLVNSQAQTGSSSTNDPQGGLVNNQAQTGSSPTDGPEDSLVNNQAQIESSPTIVPPGGFVNGQVQTGSSLTNGPHGGLVNSEVQTGSLSTNGPQTGIVFSQAQTASTAMNGQQNGFVNSQLQTGSSLTTDQAHSFLDSKVQTESSSTDGPLNSIGNIHAQTASLMTNGQQNGLINSQTQTANLPMKSQQNKGNTSTNISEKSLVNSQAQTASSSTKGVNDVVTYSSISPAYPDLSVDKNNETTHLQAKTETNIPEQSHLENTSSSSNNAVIQPVTAMPVFEGKRQIASDANVDEVTVSPIYVSTIKLLPTDGVHNKAPLKTTNLPLAYNQNVTAGELLSTYAATTEMESSLRENPIIFTTVGGLSNANKDLSSQSINESPVENYEPVTGEHFPAYQGGNQYGGKVEKSTQGDLSNANDQIATITESMKSTTVQENAKRYSISIAITPEVPTPGGNPTIIASTNRKQITPVGLETTVSTTQKTRNGDKFNKTPEVIQTSPTGVVTKGNSKVSHVEATKKPLTEKITQDSYLNQESNVQPNIIPDLILRVTDSQNAGQLSHATSALSVENTTKRLVTLQTEVTTSKSIAKTSVNQNDLIVTQQTTSHLTTSTVNPTTSKPQAPSSSVKPVLNSDTVTNNNHTGVAKKPIFTCKDRLRGKYSDPDDCRKFYICSGLQEPIIGLCPVNTVFSEIKTQCTKNLSHCIRNNQFKCASKGRFSDYLQQNIYYICVQNTMHNFIRFKFQCQMGYYLNKTTVRCLKIPEVVNLSSSFDNISKSTVETISNEDKKPQEKTKPKKEDDFECEKQGKFADENNCRRYYVCSKSKKSEEFRRRIKKCDSDEVFHKDKKKCVDAESYEC